METQVLIQMTWLCIAFAADLAQIWACGRVRRHNVGFLLFQVEFLSVLH